MFAKAKPNNLNEAEFGFYPIDITKKDDKIVDKIIGYAKQARADNNVYGLSQCIFELYRMFLWSWNSFKLDSESYEGESIFFTRGSPPTLAQDGSALYFKRILESYVVDLNELLTQTDQIFWDNFYKKYSNIEECNLNSFFNLISYISDHLKDLNMGFNNVATMAFIHNASVLQCNNLSNNYKNIGLKARNNFN